MKKLLGLILVIGLLTSCGGEDQNKDNKIKANGDILECYEGWNDEIHVLSYKVNDMEYKVFTNVVGGGVHVVNVTLDQLRADELDYNKMHR